MTLTTKKYVKTEWWVTFWIWAAFPGCLWASLILILYFSKFSAVEVPQQFPSCFPWESNSWARCEDRMHCIWIVSPISPLILLVQGAQCNNYTGLQILGRKCPLFGFWRIPNNFWSLNPKSVFDCLVWILHCCQFCAF